MKLLFGTDGSDCSAAAGRLLARLPWPAGTEVTVLSAVRESSWVTALPLEGEMATGGCIYDRLAQITAEEEAAARRTAEAAAAALQERGLTATVLVRRRRPAAALLEQAQEEGAGLVVVGSHGKGAMESFLLGSVSERVARYAPCSVLVSRGDMVRRVIVGLDGSETAAAALELLTRLPLPDGAELRVVHVLQPREMPLGEKKALEPADRQRLGAEDRVVQEALERLRAAVRVVTGEVWCGATAASLVEAAVEADADLIVLGVSRHAGPGPFFLGCVSGWVLIHAPCSVLLARRAAGGPHGEAPAAAD